MNNLDFKNDTMVEAREQLFKALRTNDEGTQQEAFNNFLAGLESNITEQVKSQADQFQSSMADDHILAERGLRRAMTTKEKKFFAEAVQKKKIEGLNELFPKTIVEDVYRNLVQEHPIISLIDVRQGNVKTEFIYGDATKKTAFWGNVPDNIKQILLDAFKSLDISASKLSGFIAVPKGYYELGPDWLANYVITFLKEVMAATLEEAIVNGDGKNKPLGMTRKLSGDSGGSYPAKDKVNLTDLTPKSLAGVRSAFAKAKTDNGQIYALVNPLTYWSKIFPKLAHMTDSGTWVTTALPTGEVIVLTHAVAEDTIVFGNPKNYLLVVASDVEITEYKETLAVEDMDLHIAKFFGKGIAKNANAFFVADVTSVDGASVASLEAEAAIKSEDTVTPIDEL